MNSKSHSLFGLGIALILAFSLADPVSAQRRPGSRSVANLQQQVVRFLTQEMRTRTITGAQCLVGSGSQASRAVCLGYASPGGRNSVSNETQFCIASCSKPLASAVVFALLDQRQLSLSQPAGALLPELNSVVTQDGTRTRGPTLRELLCHRGGIYSQSDRPSAIQMKAIRDFRLTLDESVDVITRQPLASVPGTKYAYSGAGYCLVGSMAEKATDKPFETLLQEHLCRPLGMENTSYFPDGVGGVDIALGARTKLMVPASLGDALKLPLIGGSLHSTASDLGRFCQMVLARGTIDGTTVFSRRAWDFFVSRPYPDQTYGFGWQRSQTNRQLATLSHKGSLPPYQASLRIDVDRKCYSVVLYTLARPADVSSTRRIASRLDQLISQ